MFSKLLTAFALLLTLACGASSQVPGTFNPLLRAGGSGTPLTVVFTHNAISTTAGTSFTFASVAFGDAASDRYTAVCAGGTDSADNFSISTITINGISVTSSGVYFATLNSTAASSRVVVMRCGIVANPTGTSGNVVIAFSESVSGSGISVWSITGGLLSTTPISDPTPVAVNGTTQCNASGVTVATLSGGVAFGFAWANNYTSSQTGTWSGSVSIVSDFTGSEASLETIYAGSHKITVGGGGTIIWQTTNNVSAGCVYGGASFR